MCVYSMVLQEFAPLIPYPSPGPSPWAPPPQPNIVPIGPLAPWDPLAPTPAFPLGQMLTPEQLAQVLEAFRQAAEAAKKADEITGQKDCTDPAKQKLEARVAELEKLLEELRAKSGPFVGEKATRPRKPAKTRKHGAGKKRRPRSHA